ncbi:MAG: cell division protein ZapA [Candidatus Rokubacteria bacterium]|nr:cell division protein ZapA [Candidatus Rokubacteria bacterium]
MSELHRVDVEILGQRLTLRSEASPEHVRRLAGFIEGRVQEIRGDGPSPDPLKLLTLATLDITDELFRLRDEGARRDGDASARVGALRRLLDSAVEHG